MFNLYEILQNAQNGEAMANLARQFNISSEQADAAVKALMPTMSAAFLNRSADPTAFGSILGAMGDPQHLSAFADPSAAQAHATTEKGADVLTQLFGSNEMSAQAATQAASLAGLSPALVQQMAPVIASMVIGGLSKGLASQGWGGLFGQLANAAGQGGLASILGGLLGGAPQAQPGAAGQAAPGNPNVAGGAASAGFGSLAGMFGTILSSFLGGGAAPQGGPNAPQSAPHPAPQSVPGGFDMSAIQAGLEALTKMLQPGTAPQPTQQAGLQDDISSILDGKKRS